MCIVVKYSKDKHSVYNCCHLACCCNSLQPTGQLTTLTLLCKSLRKLSCGRAVAAAFQLPLSKVNPIMVPNGVEYSCLCSYSVMLFLVGICRSSLLLSVKSMPTTQSTSTTASCPPLKGPSPTTRHTSVVSKLLG